MKWLDELKTIRDKPIRHEGYRKIMKFTLSWKQLDRLIEIAEGAEWGDYSIGQMYDYGCLFCKAEKNADDKHEPICPYSDEWKKVDPKD